jgi:iron complex transport system substrate-binding protein
VKRSLIALAAALVVVGGACTGSTATGAPSAGAAASAANGRPAAGPVEVTDALGRKVDFSSPPARIAIAGRALFMVADAVYLFPEASERVTALGSTVQNKAGFVPVIDPNYANKTVLDGSAGAEEIAATHPDVVLLKSSNEQMLGKPLEAIGVKVVYVDFETPDQYDRDLTTVGELLGDTARADQLIAYFHDQVGSVTSALSGISDAQKPRVLMLYYSAKNGTVAFNVPPLGYIQTTEVELAGGNPVWKDAQLGSGWTTVTLEQIAAWDPDQIYVIAYTGSASDVVSSLEADPRWQALRAVKAGNLHAFPGDYYSWDQPDPRWSLGLHWLALKIHPDRFPGLDMNAQIRAFYRDLYGLDAAAFEKDIQPYLSGDLN